MLILILKICALCTPQPVVSLGFAATQLATCFQVDFVAAAAAAQTALSNKTPALQQLDAALTLAAAVIVELPQAMFTPEAAVCSVCFFG